MLFRRRKSIRSSVRRPLRRLGFEQLEDRRLLAAGGDDHTPLDSTASTGDIAEVPGLPRVLLIGDSISIGYTGPTQEMLRGLANVYRIPGNGLSTINGLAHIDEWLGDDAWDVIHFNWGLHDIRINGSNQPSVSINDYETNLSELVDRLAQTGAELIWATTTPVPGGVPLDPLRISGDEVVYNEVAANIVTAAQIRTDDLYSFALDQLNEIQNPADVHYTPEGYVVLAGQVVDEILQSPNVQFVSCFEVTNTNDSGVGSLRTAIDCANAFPGLDTITFDIPGEGPHTITPLSPLPKITDTIVIDGTTDPDYAGQPVIQVDGSLAGPDARGFLVKAGPSAIRGMAINGFDSAAIQLGSSDGHTIEDNYIGTDISGAAARPNRDGIRLSKSSGNIIRNNVISGNAAAGLRVNGSLSTDNQARGNLIGTDSSGNIALGNNIGVDLRGAQYSRIGGSGAGDGNVISSNQGAGIQLIADNNQVQGNRIGTNRSGDAALPNRDGVRIALAAGNTIGGAASGEGNQISGNEKAGIRLETTREAGNMVTGNLIGTNADGSAALGNTNGIILHKAPNNTIGGADDGTGNTISGNRKNGVLIAKHDSANNVVAGNQIGVNNAGDAALANGRHGVFLFASPNNLIGGTEAGAGNVIAGNQGDAVRIWKSKATGNRIEGNTIGATTDGAEPMANDNGVKIGNGAKYNTIGGEVAGAANVIAHNRENGVQVASGRSNGNTISRNSIYDNGGLGILLGIGSRTLNDVDDRDAGPNRSQNFPVIDAAVLGLGELSITFSVPSMIGSSAYPLTVEFFTADASGKQGKTYVGQYIYTVPGPKIASFPADTISPGMQIVATATDANGNSSEFSDPLTIGEPPLTASSVDIAFAAIADE